MKTLLNKIKIAIFGDPKLFVVFSNPEYDGALSIKHRGGYVYINPPQFGGAGISCDPGACASMSTLEDVQDLLSRFVKLKYKKDITEFKIKYLAHQ